MALYAQNSPRCDRSFASVAVVGDERGSFGTGCAKRSVLFVPIARNATRSTALAEARCRWPRHSGHCMSDIRWRRWRKSLAEGIVTGHPSMPEFKLDPGQVGDVIAYLKSLER